LRETGCQVFLSAIDAADLLAINVADGPDDLKMFHVEQGTVKEATWPPAAGQREQLDDE